VAGPAGGRPFSVKFLTDQKIKINRCIDWQNQIPDSYLYCTAVIHRFEMNNLKIALFFVLSDFQAFCNWW